MCRRSALAQGLYFQASVSVRARDLCDTCCAMTDHDREKHKVP